MKRPFSKQHNFSFHYTHLLEKIVLIHSSGLVENFAYLME